MSARNPAVADLLARYKRELREFDARPAQYKPRWQITPVGAALLLHGVIDGLNHGMTAAGPASDSQDVGVDGGDA